MKKFNYKKAKTDGYSDEEIQEYLKNKYSYNFNIVNAKKDGYTDDEIEAHINKRIIEITSSSSSSSPTLTTDDIKNGKLVKFGMTGDIVSEIQKLLLQKGYNKISKTGKIDGIFGVGTYNSVKKFQELNGLKPDGVVGPLTFNKLTDANAVKYTGLQMSTSSQNQQQIKECNNFPFSFGCKNQKIGEIRKKLIGDNKDVYDKDLYNAIKEDLKPGDKRITQDIYNKIMGI